MTRFLALCVLVAATLVSSCLAQDLQVRASKNSSLPAPVSVAPDQDWDGIDGSWNTITLRIGTPPQFVRALASTASQQTWTIHSLACVVNQTDAKTNQTHETTDTDCESSRGHLFNISVSSTWQEIGFYQLWTEKVLGMMGNGEYGYDTVGLGHPGEEGPTLKNTTVGTLVTPNFWLGHFGLNAKPTNFSAFTDPSPSYMTYLFQQNLIPSLSFGYTAGAQYHFTSVLSSLTLGGYDTSRFIPNDLTFGFAPDNERDLVVGVVGIHVNSVTKSNVNLLSRDQFTMYIDSTVAELWLPIEICQAFEQSFGLKYDNDTGLYLVDDLTHKTLVADNATITFSLGQKFSTNTTVDIMLPYKAFDKVAKPPYQGLKNQSNYFPIRRATQENQFVLGRTFLQEAYLIVDWERQNFSISQCSWVYGQPKNIVSITSPMYPGEKTTLSSKPKRTTTGAIIGIAVGSGFSFAMIVFGVLWFFWRRRQKRHLEQVKAEYATKAAAAAKEAKADKSEEPPTSPTKYLEEGTNVFPKAELPAESLGRSELDTTDVKAGDPTSPNSLGVPSPAAEVDNTERQIFEMPGDIPTRQEADGRQLSEKESMMVRERIYNGVDPTGPPEVSPSSEEPPRRLAPVSPSEVQLVNRRNQPNISPVTPRTPRDGAFLEANDTFFQPPRAPRDGRYLEAEDTLLSPISPMESTDSTSRRRFSYE
ncbi:acid protease [Lindgomyces ingoldianus]|uniref:Acid protease n=1 Tax=Lindgomyces ingoldianus TaxID=673940 RepID=A0ACB6R952_9PLEO|nr:acid protease [Lindgomyces ingoldianus]KAF2475298.1 acid protease [Lindgomyces ingoldianus]